MVFSDELGRTLAGDGGLSPNSFSAKSVSRSSASRRMNARRRIRGAARRRFRARRGVPNPVVASPPFSCQHDVAEAFVSPLSPVVWPRLSGQPRWMLVRPSPSPDPPRAPPASPAMLALGAVGVWPCHLGKIQSVDGREPIPCECPMVEPIAWSVRRIRPIAQRPKYPDLLSVSSGRYEISSMSAQVALLIRDDLTSIEPKKKAVAKYIDQLGVAPSRGVAVARPDGEQDRHSVASCESASTIIPAAVFD